MSIPLASVDSGMALIRAKRGGLAAVARGLRISGPAVVKWKKVPAERVVDIERITGIPRQQLRPDLYAPPGELEPAA